MQQESIKQIFEPDEIMKCPHCGDVASVGGLGNPRDMGDAHSKKMRLWDNPLYDINSLHWDWSEECANCGKKFNVKVVYQVTK